ncbi:MAG TPA: prepilin peptidase [Verrucomicrobiae bacterium]|nr:prepilin peptidase [Verrucomicrobiae bacterium]
MAGDTGGWAHAWTVLPFGFWAVCFFAFGCIVGSFLNVCIHRMPRGLSVVSPPSHCPHCKYSIPWYLNIPLVTWLALRGRCKNCGAPISPRYFIVELLTGIAFLGTWCKFGDVANPLPTIPLALVYVLFLAGLIAATFIDFEHFIIPDEITLGGIVVGLLLSFLLPQMHDTSLHWHGLLQGFIGVAVGAGIVYAVLRFGKLLFGRHRLKLHGETKIIFSETAVHLPDREISYDDLFYRKSDAVVVRARTVELVDRGFKDVTVKLSPSVLEIGGEKMSPDEVPFMECVSAEIVLPREAMGLGDVKFMGAIGAFVGWQGAVFSLLASSMIGAAVGLLLIIFGRREFSSRMPYGPYIALAAVIWLFGKKFFMLFFPELGGVH